LKEGEGAGERGEQWYQQPESEPGMEEKSKLIKT
jgi:hypothetical protein